MKQNVTLREAAAEGERGSEGLRARLHKVPYRVLEQSDSGTRIHPMARRVIAVLRMIAHRPNQCKNVSYPRNTQPER